MSTVLLYCNDDKQYAELTRIFEEKGFQIKRALSCEELNRFSETDLPELLFLDFTFIPNKEIQEVSLTCRSINIPSLALFSTEVLTNYAQLIEADDFLVAPPDTSELTFRIRNLLWHSNGHSNLNPIRIGGLVINQEKYEVLLDREKISLTFKEYELLRLMASSPGRVFTREGLLSQLWGYDYFGGTRTVDVHIRRLRSKIENTRHSFIETVWNVGYRFVENSGSR